MAGGAVNPFPKAPMAPELDGNEGWLNTSDELSLKELRGKIVVLDFWTFCCINCMHVLPDLKQLEEKYAKQVVVIGVHSGKFANEKSSETIRAAILRYHISHPVINDADFSLWRKFGVNSWPTFVVIDPEGRQIGEYAGEAQVTAIDGIINSLLPYHRARGTLDEAPLKFRLEQELSPPTPLRFPGKILADEPGDRLFISDSSHNRIVITTLQGKLLDIIGSGQAGRMDGPYATAEFDRQQGMALVRDTLYVADTENHMLRAVNLTTKTVTTIAGTGQRADIHSLGGPALTSPLNSPWDLVHVAGKLYIAMSGPHQIWGYDPQFQVVGVYAGNSKEDVRNGPLLDASFGQPSGITSDGKFLYVADAEGNAIRKVPLALKARVTTLAGTSDLPKARSLFEYGDKDGRAGAARFQHPLGVLRAGDLLYVADSYNHKIKSIEIKTGLVKTLWGDGRAGAGNQPARFSEPGGLTMAGNTLYVADTNNHVVRKVDLATQAVSTLAINDLAPPAKRPVRTQEQVVPEVVTPRQVATADNVTFRIELNLPPGYKLNQEYPGSFRLAVAGAQTLLAPDKLGDRVEVERVDDSTVQFSVPLTAKTGKAEVMVTLTYGYCTSGKGGLCKIGTLAWTVPLTVALNAAESEVKLAGPD